jgi:hypothetical protein
MATRGASRESTRHIKLSTRATVSQMEVVVALA